MGSLSLLSPKTLLHPIPLEEVGGISSSVAECAGCGGGGGGGVFAEESTTGIWEGFVLTGELWRNINGKWCCVGPKVQQTPTGPWD